ncbi:ribonuclease R [Niveibacterium sp. 24ML]|uniref:ribonuclease R n=1 Tax=Niveibacterium sp. 24ML TaxID=2985512 RepID=UPI002271C7A0|nr:ribonuclease R [Niveibacterium sp. 24ML]MCX9155105.1 ribonuclease R [Niveibacterium sp. 24ML]
MTGEELADALAIREEEEAFFARRLGAMERDGQLMRNRRNAYIIPDKADLIRGRVEGHADGFGFLKPDEGGDDLFLGPREMKEVLHGDRALVRVTGSDWKGRREAKIVEVLERANTRVVGRVVVEHGVHYVVAENRRINQEIMLAREGRTKLPLAGQVVTVELIQQPTKNSQPIGKVVELLGAYADPGMEIEIALRKHDLPFEFSKAAKAQAARIPDQVRPSDLGGIREDLRALPLVTIDGETAKDFDDAVYAERLDKGWRLIVAIADVSHYVTEGSALDKDAYERGNSVYFPRRVIPMLPEKLSNGLCSLNPHVDRLCMVCDMAISVTGKIQRYRFYPAVMHSKARLTYNKVAAAIYEKDEAMRAELAPVLPQLEVLDEVFRTLLKARARRGAIDFETTETRMVFNDQGKIEKIVPESRNDAHRLIEECMLAANVCASEYLEFNEQPSLYRIHAGPSVEKLEKLRTFLSEFGLDLGGGEEPAASDFARLIDRIRMRPDRQLLQTVMLRSLRQAMYSPDNVGHFGLAYDAYTHFTSPIRRYPDLLVHRAIKAVLARQTSRRSKKAEASAPLDLDEVGAHCSATERRADEATRDVEAWLKCFFMQDRIGEEFEGSVSAAVPFGIFVALDDVFIEGLVHISDLGADYFHFDDARHELVGERTGQRFRLSDRVRVQLVRVDLESRKIDFRLVAAAAPATARVGKTARDSARGGRESVPSAKLDDEIELLSWRELQGVKASPAGRAPRGGKAAPAGAPREGRAPRSGGKAAPAKAGARAKPKAGGKPASQTKKAAPKGGPRKKGARRG